MIKFTCFFNIYCNKIINFGVTSLVVWSCCCWAVAWHHHYSLHINQQQQVNVQPQDCSHSLGLWMFVLREYVYIQLPLWFCSHVLSAFQTAILTWQTRFRWIFPTRSLLLMFKTNTWNRQEKNKFIKNNVFFYRLNNS